MNNLQISGAFTALVTPFTADGKIDWSAFETLVRGQLDGGIHGLVPCGTTGESPTLTDAEQVEVIRRTVILTNKRVPVVAGAGSNSTAKTIHHAQGALEAGADAVMIMMPYYNKPSQEGMYQHVLAVAKEVGGAPVVLYNIPPRCVVDLSHETLLRIAEAAPNVIAVKDATGSVVRCQQTVAALGNRMTVMCGDDALTVAMMACGARGVISVTSNVYPTQVAMVCELVRQNQWDEARRLQTLLLSVHEAMFLEPSPAPVKAALAHLGRMEPHVRLPLVPASENAKRRIVDAIARFGTMVRG